MDILSGGNRGTWPQGDHQTPVRLAAMEKSEDNSLGKEVEGAALVHCWWECRPGQPLWTTACRCLRKLKIELLWDPAISLLSIYLQ